MQQRIERDYLILHLSLLDGIGPATIKKLINNKQPEYSWNDFYDADVKSLMTLSMV